MKLFQPVKMPSELKVSNFNKTNKNICMKFRIQFSNQVDTISF
jgi:hypothetical protein